MVAIAATLPVTTTIAIAVTIAISIATIIVTQNCGIRTRNSIATTATTTATTSNNAVSVGAGVDGCVVSSQGIIAREGRRV